MRACVDIGIDAQRHRRDLPRLAGEAVEALDLGLALDVEALDAGGERRAHLRFRLAHAREEHAIGAPARTPQAIVVRLNAEGIGGRGP